MIRKKWKETDESTAGTPDVQRPFMVGDHHLVHQQQQQQLLAQKPLPPTPFMQSQWTTAKVYPKMVGGNLAPTESSYADCENSKDFDSVTNQYEVPYAHLLPLNSTSSSTNSAGSCGSVPLLKPRQFIRSTDCISSSGNAYYDPKISSQSGPITVFSSDHPSYSMKHNKHFHYHSDYDSQ